MQKHYQGPADSRCTPPLDFKVGQEVLVHSEYFWSTRPSKKLLDKYFGPYPIIAQASNQSYTLHLSNSMCAVHPVFHVSQLESSVQTLSQTVYNIPSELHGLPRGIFDPTRTLTQQKPLPAYQVRVFSWVRLVVPMGKIVPLPATGYPWICHKKKCFQDVKHVVRLY